MLVVTAMVAMVCSIAWRGSRLVHYVFLIFAVGPWFAWLVSECLPIPTPRSHRRGEHDPALLFIVVLRLKRRSTGRWRSSSPGAIPMDASTCCSFV
jgi:hypothetical protein